MSTAAEILKWTFLCPHVRLFLVLNSTLHLLFCFTLLKKGELRFELRPCWDETLMKNTYPVRKGVPKKSPSALPRPKKGVK